MPCRHRACPAAASGSRRGSARAAFAARARPWPGTHPWRGSLLLPRFGLAARPRRAERCQSPWRPAAPAPRPGPGRAVRSGGPIRWLRRSWCRASGHELAAPRPCSSAGRGPGRSRGAPGLETRRRLSPRRAMLPWRILPSASPAPPASSRRGRVGTPGVARPAVVSRGLHAPSPPGACVHRPRRR